MGDVMDVSKAKFYVSLINKIKRDIPDATLRTSLIVGFPGETDEDFYELYDFLKEYNLKKDIIEEYMQK